MNIFVEMPEDSTRETFLTPPVVELLESLGNVTWNNLGRHCTQEEFAQALVGQDVCITGWGVPKFDEAVMEKARDLKLVAHTAGTVYHIATDALKRRGVRITCGNDIFAASVAEGTLAYILTALRHIPHYVQVTQEKGWPGDEDFAFSESLYHRTVGLVGLGTISRKLIPLLEPFHVNIKVYSGHMTHEEAARLGVEKCGLEEIFSSCDIISLHCAKSPKNYHLVDDHLLGLTRPGALLVNTARGDIVDETVLARYLNAGRIRAVLDVYEEEPLPDSSPLRAAKNVILIPHLGGPTIDLRAAAATDALEDVRRFRDGEPMMHEVTYERASQMTH